MFGLMVFIFFQDIDSILADDFDHKKWINEALQSMQAHETPEPELSALILNLQAMLDNANREVENVFQEVAQATPRFIREMESVNQQALLLKQHTDSVQHDFQKIHIDGNETLKELAELDLQRKRTKMAADALREANRWATLVNSRNSLIGGDNVDQLYQLILDMEQSISYMEQLPDYDSRVALLSGTKDRLETLVAPQLMELLDNTTLSRSHSVLRDEESVLRNLVSMFIAIKRGDVAMRYYTSWLANRIKTTWESENRTRSNTHEDNIEEGILIDCSLYESVPTNQIRRFFSFLINFLDVQLSLDLFAQDTGTLILKGIVSILDTISSDVSKRLATEVTSKRLEFCVGLLNVTDENARSLCSILYRHGLKASCLDTATGSEKEISQLCLEIVRLLAIPLAQINDVFECDARRRLDEVLQTFTMSSHEEYSLVTELKHSSESAITEAFDLLLLCRQKTNRLSAAGLLVTLEEFCEKLAAKWHHAFEVTASQLIADDIATGYTQATGLSSVLSIVAATGNYTLQLDKFIQEFRLSAENFFELSSQQKTEAECIYSPASSCPFHKLFFALIGEAQPSARWSVLQVLCPAIIPVIEPLTASKRMTDRVSSVDPLFRLSHVGTRLCRGAVAMAVRVSMAPVKDLLSQLPRAQIWSSRPASGDSVLSDLAYLPQEYITQMGQYIFNLPEQLLPFMESGSESVAMNSQGLVECLLRGSPEGTFKDASAPAVSRTRLTSISSPPPASPTQETASSSTGCIAAWLDWLIAGQMSEAFIRACLEIPPGKLPQQPGLTEHGAKQLTIDLNYLLGLLEELSLPTPSDLVDLRDLINCPAESFQEMSRQEQKPGRLVSLVISLRNL